MVKCGVQIALRLCLAQGLQISPFPLPLTEWDTPHTLELVWCGTDYSLMRQLHGHQFVMNRWPLA